MVATDYNLVNKIVTHKFILTWNQWINKHRKEDALPQDSMPNSKCKTSSETGS